MTAAIDAAADSVTPTPDLEDLDFMLQFDALWVDLRSSTELLSADELDNIAAFLNTGRRAVIIGEYAAWWEWNNQIVGLGGGVYGGQDKSGIVPVNADHELTAGVVRVRLGSDGCAASINIPVPSRDRDVGSRGGLTFRRRSGI